MTDIQLYQGDCLEVMQTLPEASIDAVITSPPYFNAREYSQYSSYEEYLAFLETFFSGVRRVLKKNRILAVNLSCVIEARSCRDEESKRWPIPFDAVGLAIGQGFKFLDDIVWKKPDGASGRAIKFAHHRRPVAYKPFQVTEYILVFKNGEGLLDTVIREKQPETIALSLVEGEYERTNIWEIAPDHRDGHPAIFPLALADKLVRYYSFVSDVILDPFLGSGTTGVAACQAGRNFIGIEKEPAYFALADQRISQRQLAFMEM